MIKVKHPDPECNSNQEELIASLPPEKRHFHELQFCFGNAAYLYHQRGRNSNPTIEDYKEWLEGLPENIRKDMAETGFEKCKGVLSFTRYVNEKNDIGMDEFVTSLMGDEHEEYKRLAGIDFKL